MNAMTQLPDGRWVPAQPIEGSRLYRLERRLRATRRPRLVALARLLAWYDELWLG